MEHTKYSVYGRLARPCNANDLFLSGYGLECGNCGAWEAIHGIGHFVIVGKWSYDTPRKMYYQIKEYVTQEKLYIVLPEIYSLVSDAIIEIEKMECKTNGIQCKLELDKYKK